QQLSPGQVQASDGPASTVEAPLVAAATPLMNRAAAALNPSLATEDCGPTATADSKPGDAEWNPAAVPQASLSSGSPAELPTTKDQPQVFAGTDPASAPPAGAQPLDLMEVLPFTGKSEVSEVTVRAPVVTPGKQQPQSPSGGATPSGVSFLSAAATKLVSSLPLAPGSKPSGFPPPAELTSNSFSGSRIVTPPNTPSFTPGHSENGQRDPAPSQTARASEATDTPTASPQAVAGPSSSTAPAESVPQDNLGAHGDASTPSALAAMPAAAAPEPAAQTTGGAAVERPAQPASEAGA